MIDSPRPISRRRWMAGGLALAGINRRAIADDARVSTIRARARQANMEPFDPSESAHFLAIGDAPARFREEALAVSEAVSADYLKVFREKGFAVEMPPEKLLLIVLLGPKSYAKFEGGFIDEAVGGHFDLEDNRLVTFDFRGPGANPKAPIPEQDNTLTLVHETIHQLTFNTGLLDLKADIPLCISEGLATYGETWSPRRKHLMGERNARRLLGLNLASRQGLKWIPIARLLEDDKALNDAKTQQLAYAESWLLVSRLLKDKDRLPGFRDYLAALRSKPEPARRMELATNHLGDLDKLDKEVRSNR